MDPLNSRFCLGFLEKFASLLSFVCCNLFWISILMHTYVTLLQSYNFTLIAASNSRACKEREEGTKGENFFTWSFTNDTTMQGWIKEGGG